jgi:transposase
VPAMIVRRSDDYRGYRGAVEALIVRRHQLERQIAEQLPGSPWAQTARRLMCMRGIDTLTAAGLCTEIGDFGRFRHPEQFMSYLGVVRPSTRLGRGGAKASTTKSGSRHARRPAGRSGMALPPASTAQRAAQAPPGRRGPRLIVALSWKTQRRLHRAWTRMKARGKRRTIIAVAAASELAGFCWAITTA